MRGKIILILVNSPSCVSTSIEPACCLTIMSWLMERPRPVSSFIIAEKKNSRDDSEGLFRGLEPI